MTDIKKYKSVIASLQNKISKAKSSYGEDEPAKKEKENLSYNR